MIPSQFAIRTATHRPRSRMRRRLAMQLYRPAGRTVTQRRSSRRSIFTFSLASGSYAWTAWTRRTSCPSSLRCGPQSPRQRANSASGLARSSTSRRGAAGDRLVRLAMAFALCCPNRHGPATSPPCLMPMCQRSSPIRTGKLTLPVGSLCCSRYSRQRDRARFVLLCGRTSIW